MSLQQKTYDRFIGVDPGVSGALAALDVDGQIIGTIPMPLTDHGFVSAAKKIAGYGLSVGFPARWVRGVAVVEQVNAGVFGMPGRKQGAVSAFTFGGAYRGIRVALIAAGIDVIDTTPQAWQKALDCRTRGDKNISKARAQELFPEHQITHQIADALLLAEYCRRLHVAH